MRGSLKPPMLIRLQPRVVLAENMRSPHDLWGLGFANEVDHCGLFPAREWHEKFICTGNAQTRGYPSSRLCRLTATQR